MRKFIRAPGITTTAPESLLHRTKENIMRNIILLGFASLVIVCGAVGADARSSDEEDTPQASVARIYASPRTPSPAAVNLRAEHKPVGGARRPAAAPAQEDEHVGY
jgi:hypothetical protein